MGKPVLWRKQSFLYEKIKFKILELLKQIIKNLTRERPILFFYSKEELNAVILRPKYQKFIWGNLFYGENSHFYTKKLNLKF